MKEMDRFSRYLPVDLTLEEIKAKSDALVKLLFEQDECKEKKADQNKSLNDRIKSIGKQVGRISEVIRAGREDRELEVIKRGYFESNTVELVRTDTMKVFEVRAMTSEERERFMQMDIFGKNEPEEQSPAPEPPEPN